MISAKIGTQLRQDGKLFGDMTNQNRSFSWEGFSNQILQKRTFPEKNFISKHPVLISIVCFRVNLEKADPSQIA